jgi:hypothetical protein
MNLESDIDCLHELCNPFAPRIQVLGIVADIQSETYLKIFQKEKVINKLQHTDEKLEHTRDWKDLVNVKNRLLTRMENSGTLILYYKNMKIYSLSNNIKNNNIIRWNVPAKFIQARSKVFSSEI